MFDKFIDKVYKSGIHDLKIVENFEVNDDDVDFDGEKIEDTITISINMLKTRILI